MEISQLVLPPKMLSLLEEAEFESVGRIVMEHLVNGENQAILTLRIVGGEIGEQRWRLIIENPEAERIVEPEASWLAVYADHCLLWDHADDETELYVNGMAPFSPEYVSAHFYELHRRAFGDWLSLDDYVNSAGLLAAVRMPQGLFARGARRLLEQYCTWLNELGKPAYLYESDGLAMHNARRKKKGLQLLLLGRSYFIGTQFLFQRLAN